MEFNLLVEVKEDFLATPHIHPLPQRVLSSDLLSGKKTNGFDLFTFLQELWLQLGKLKRPKMENKMIQIGSRDELSCCVLIRQCPSDSTRSFKTQIRKLHG